MKASIRKIAEPLFPANYWLLLFCIVLVPFTYGLLNVNLLGGIFGVITSGLGLTMVWAIAGYSSLKRRYNLLADLTTDALDANSQLQTAVKVKNKLLEERQDDGRQE